MYLGKTSAYIHSIASFLCDGGLAMYIGFACAQSSNGATPIMKVVLSDSVLGLCSAS